jgi:hypothetical protein
MEGFLFTVNVTVRLPWLQSRTQVQMLEELTTVVLYV